MRLNLTPTGSDNRPTNRSSSHPTREQAPPKKSPLQRPIPVHTPTTKTRHLTSSIETRNRLIIRLQHTTSKVGLHSSQRLARENRESYSNQGTRGRIEQLVRLRHANEPVSQERARPSDCYHLSVLTESIPYLAVARHNLLLQLGRINQCLSSQFIHGANQAREGAFPNKVHTLPLEGLNGARRTREDPAERLENAPARQIRVLFGARQGKLAFNDALVEQEPRIVIPGRGDVLECPERIKAREKWDRQAMPSRIQPQRCWSTQNTNSMAAPDRRVIGKTIWIMPHPSGIDEVSPARRHDFKHASVNIVVHPRNQPPGRRPPALRPAAAHQVMVAANAS